MTVVSAPECFEHVIANRRSARAFSSRSIEPAVLARLFDAARSASSASNEQPWRFIVGARAAGATPQERGTFDRIAATLVPFNAGWASKAPVLALSIAQMNSEKSGKPNRYAFHDVGQAAAQLALAAAAEGLSAHQMGGFDVEKARDAFQIPAGYEPVAAIAIGYPGSGEDLPENLREREHAPRSRRPLHDIVFAGGWGEPAWPALHPHPDQR
jgi:nitroreductase